MTQETFIQDLLKAAQAAGIAEAEACFQQSEAFETQVRAGEIEVYSVNTTGGLSLRGLVNGKMGTAYTEALDEAAIGMLVKSVLESAALINDEDEQFIFAGSPAYETVDCTGDSGTVDALLELALELDRLGRSLDPRVKELNYVGVETQRGTQRIVNTHGLNLSHTADYSVAYVGSIAREGARTTTGMAYKGAHNLAELGAEAIARESVEEAVDYLDAAPCDSGEMPIIFRNTAMGSMLGVFSGIFSAEAAQKGLSLLKGKEGETIAAPCVTIVDDPLKKNGAATRPFDAEGVATYTKNVVDSGVLMTLLHNLKTAKKAGCTTTGNAARGGYAGPVTVAPTNFYIKPGDMDLDALMLAMGSGLVVTDVAGLHAGADPVSGDFSLLSKGFLVENGKKARAVEQVTIAGNFFQMLKDIVAVGSDIRQSLGSAESPSVWVKALSVAGK